MQTLINTPTDSKNQNLANLVYALRQELDIYCLISTNADSIKKRGAGKKFLAYLQRLAITSITLSICKIYEHQTKGYELNSISGVLLNLVKDSAIALDNIKVKDFIQKYDGKFDNKNLISALEGTIKKFRKKYKNELQSFKTFRDKYAAHSEYGFKQDKLPSYDVMQKLLLFAADFCELVYRQFVGVGVVNMTGRDVKSSFIGVLKELGFEDIRTEMQ